VYLALSAPRRFVAVPARIRPRQRPLQRRPLVAEQARVPTSTTQSQLHTDRLANRSNRSYRNHHWFCFIMTLSKFIDSIDNLVREWDPQFGEHGTVPRKHLEKIYDDLREQAVHGLAEAVRQRDEALKQLHKHIVDCD